MELGLAGKRVIVTGGASNIGRAIVHAFSREGALVWLADVDEEGASATAREARGEVQVVRTDVTSWRSVQRLVARALEGGPVDVLVNCAGWTVDRLFIEKPRDEWEREIAIDM